MTMKKVKIIEKNKNIKKFLLLLILIIFLCILYKIISLYAIFHSEVNGNVEFNNGTWNIMVNGTEISKGTDVNFVINEIKIEENEYVKSGKLAPGLSGSFTILINPNNTNVSVKYDITLDQTNLKNKNLKIKSIKEVQEGNSLIKTGENTYTGVIPLANINAGVKNEVLTEIEWLDDKVYDKDDTSLGSNWDEKLQIPINVHVSQYLGEQIVPFNN